MRLTTLSVDWERLRKPKLGHTAMDEPALPVAWHTSRPLAFHCIPYVHTKFIGKYLSLVLSEVKSVVLATVEFKAGMLAGLVGSPYSDCIFLQLLQ